MHRKRGSLWLDGAQHFKGIYPGKAAHFPTGEKLQLSKVFTDPKTFPRRSRSCTELHLRGRNGQSYGTAGAPY